MKVKNILWFTTFIFFFWAQSQDAKVSLVVLGTIQDGGSPHIGCQKDCCASLFKNPDATRKVVSIGIIDHETEETFLFEATPDLPSQMQLLQNFAGFSSEALNGVLITHAHMGHYTGLMYLGREALGSKSVPVYVMPKMKNFIENNGPWNQLVKLGNIALVEMENDKIQILTKNVKVIPFKVPHRDEYSETVGYKIIGPEKSVLFIPDIDKWNLWNRDVLEEIKQVDHAFLDATFYNGAEVGNRDISEIPHPFVIESMSLFDRLSSQEKKKIQFIHFNHTNPLLRKSSQEGKKVIENGFNIAEFGNIIRL